MQVLSYLFNTVVDLYSFLVIVAVIMSWLLSFGIINRHNQFVDMIWRTAQNLTEPALRPIRNMMPNLGGIDISPVVLIIGLGALKIGVNTYLLGPMIRAGL